MIPSPYEVRNAIEWLNGIAAEANCQLSVGVIGVTYTPMNETERSINNGDPAAVAMTIVTKLRERG